MMYRFSVCCLMLCVCLACCMGWRPVAEVLLHSRQGVFQCGELERLPAIFMRMALWLKKSTPLHSMRQELGRAPMAFEAVRRCAAFSNRLARLAEGDLLHQCWLENRDLGEGTWSGDMERLWRKAMGRDEGHLGDGDGEWEEAECWQAMAKGYEDSMLRAVQGCLEQALEGEDWGSLVRACPDEARDGFKALKYHRWFQQVPSAAGLPKAPLIMHTMPEAGNIRTMAQFRCGSHHLDCESARALGLRSTRQCRFCSTPEVEDELHLVICEAWQAARDRFPGVFEWTGYTDLLDTVRRGGDIDSSFWSFLHTMTQQQVDMFTGYLKMTFQERKRLDLAVA